MLVDQRLDLIDDATPHSHSPCIVYVRTVRGLVYSTSIHPLSFPPFLFLPCWCWLLLLAGGYFGRPIGRSGRNPSTLPQLAVHTTLLVRSITPPARR